MSWNEAACLKYRTINKSKRCASGDSGKDKTGPTFKFSKIMILRTKDRHLRERWHFKVGDPHGTETWDDSTYFSICHRPFADLNKHHDSPRLTSQGQIFSYPIRRRDSWCKPDSHSSTRRMKKAVFSHSPLPLDYKTVAPLILGAAPPRLPACISHKCPILRNRCLACHCVSYWIPSVLRHKESEAQRPDTRWMIPIKTPWVQSRSASGRVRDVFGFRKSLCMWI